jgi:glycosyltransferase involved in cell wall biosynthesis
VEQQIHFAGVRDDIPDCLSAIDIFVIPSLHETHSIGLLEAMRAGKPVVATSVGGNTESVRHEREGLIVPPGDADALAEALGRYLRQPDLRVAMGKAARLRYEVEFTEDIMLERTAAWLAEVCGGQA